LKSVLAAFQALSPEIYQILEQGKGKYNTAAEQGFIDKFYPTTPNISVDFALMEKAGNVYTIPSDFGWSDLGTWASLHAESPKDAHGNVLQGERILAYSITNCLVRTSKDKLVVLKDLHDFMVVDEPDVLLIYPKSKEQEIKQIREDVSTHFGEFYL
jgi:mannose-1-phosphate guanylyltransferase